ncbi:Predicted phosphatase [Plasmopara halstedii]|uniref:Predicted phosphatase n=1 Tax=Plasmopara halstedii TaxID=4781 RepID=A0A0P1B333_PLAHL|nr:Predicted phosphatase [Plasmopara halstedii]CEG48232.1 Predicted phosphatase [Plasmopara halstedii]|eukprot:XP_024584601.1 Predicted phosphatase [Plasmopara halstedii]
MLRFRLVRSLSHHAVRTCFVASNASKSSTCPSFGIAFDIDGVLIRGGHELPNAKRVLQSLRANNVQHIFLTNGGGCMEESKAEKLSNILGLSINPEHMILSHTPMRELTKTYGDKRVLIMGSHDVWHVAKCYGFKKVVSVQDLLHHCPAQYPFNHYEQRLAPYYNEPIEAIIVMHDPINWAPEIQVAVDVLIGGDPPGSGSLSGKQTPLFVSNDDFVFSGEYQSPRFAQGAFTKCLKLLYEDFTGCKLEMTHFGKPHTITYNYAERLLNSISGQTEPLKHIYGIGDNPSSDIQGANNVGERWTSVLVRTGVYDGVNEPDHTPDVIVDNVYEAIKHIYKREGINDYAL